MNRPGHMNPAGPTMSFMHGWAAGYARGREMVANEARLRKSLARADETIAHFESEMARLREALERIAQMNPSTAMMGAPEVARAALRSEPEGDDSCKT